MNKPNHSPATLGTERPVLPALERLPMKRTTCLPAARRHPVSRWIAAAVLCVAPAVGVAQNLLDFEGIPLTYHYDGDGFNLGDYYVGEPGGPTFGPQATVLEVGGSVDEILYPPTSGIASLWGEGLDLELTFTTAPAQRVSLSYRSGADLFLFAYDPSDTLLGSTSGPASLGSDPAGFLDFAAAGFDIARVLIVGPAGAFVIDDVAYYAVPEPAQVAWLSALGLAAFAAWRRRT
jgi:MYXO-CTERM domain-containing protein